MSEDRIKALEDGVVELRKDMAEMVSNHTELDKTLNILLVKLEAHFIEEKEYEQTIRNIDDNVDKITVQLAGGAMERHKEIQLVVDPIWDTIRKHDARFSASETSIKNDIRKNALSHIQLLWGALAIIVSMGIYVYGVDKQYRKEAVIEVQQDLERIQTTLNKQGK